jgi:hypothetical protein
MSVDTYAISLIDTNLRSHRRISDNPSLLSLASSICTMSYSKFVGFKFESIEGCKFGVILNIYEIAPKLHLRNVILLSKTNLLGFEVS